MFTLMICDITVIEHFSRLQTFQSVTMGEPEWCDEKNMGFGDLRFEIKS